MSRIYEVEIIASSFADHSKPLLRSALVAQEKGQLDAAARIVSDQLAKKPRLLWCAFLLALESAELRLGGAVSFTTPTQRFSGSYSGYYFAESWGSFFMKTYPEEIRVELLLELRGGRYELSGAFRKVSRYDPVVRDGLSILSGEIAAYLGRTVEVVGA